MHKVLWLTILVCACLTSVLLVTQCIMFYRVLRLEGELEALRNTRTGLPGLCNFAPSTTEIHKQ